MNQLGREELCECESVMYRREWAQWVGGTFTKHLCGYLGRRLSLNPETH